VRHLNILNSLLVVLFLLFGCSRDNSLADSKKEIAFYYWNSKCSIKKNFSFPLFVKVLDIGTNNIIKTTCKNREFTPVIYIDNQALKHRDIKELSKLVLNRVPIDSKEVQFDCDWTQSTKKKYFNFLREMKKHYKNISTTIRLHQLKYQTKTGIPPVDSGVLMFYNMSDFLSPNTKNYILDLNEAKKYLSGFKSYPLKLDLALPIYSMATVFRYGRVVSLIDNITIDMIDNKFEKIYDNKYRVLKTHYFRGKLLYKGDKLRIDEVSFDMLKRAIEIIPFNYKRIIFFRYSPNLSDKFIKEIQSLVEA
jgi:coenzyme F420-reducing hydrogenase delta subunit